MPDLITALPEAFSPTLLALGALLALAESVLGLGVLVPGELGVLVLGAAARTPVQVLLALVVVTLAASLADHVGYVVGRRYGTRLRGSRAVRRIGTAHWDGAARLARRRGASALVVSRLLPLVRTLMPAAAGAAQMRYHRFLAGSLAGSLLWAALWLGAGGLAGQALPAVATSLGTAGWVVLAAIVLTAGLLVLHRRTRARVRARAATVTAPDPCPAEPVPAERVLEGAC
ncbi:DedA family protein [Georgenia satyanarayanai]|uniref:DedA family protein n=1 Tax=Georgenia satyanarayanai TaxID=860221 RepID=UPI001265847B|nr:VTT domain-containing protein [Georgenia satyanarayanai]